MKQSNREKPPEHGPAANALPGVSGFDRVSTLAVLALQGRDGKAHFFGKCSADESAQGMRLPARGFEQFLGRRAAGTLQHFKDCFGLAPGSGACGFLRALGRFLGGGGLLPRLGCLRRDVARTFRTAGLLSGFWLLADGFGRGGFCFFNNRFHRFSVDWRWFRDHMNHSGRPHKQANCDGDRPWRRAGDLGQMSRNVLR